MLRNLANGWRPGSPAANLRRKRFAFFLSLLETLPGPVDVLDLGGQEAFWRVTGTDSPLIRSITLVNLWEEKVTLPKLHSTVGDARQLSAYGDQSVDVLFSNSVIEHVGSLREQQRAAGEMRRVAKRYFVQTPNRHFPLEPHFLVPFFQYLPTRLRASFHHRFNLGWWERQPDYWEALAEVESIRLLSEAELRHLFPQASVFRERLAGLTKSLVAYDGFHHTHSHQQR
ncbi:MAG TPA: methyltransferase domain-containing protein [Chthoniobacterales bacterium]|jgi:hypothetical protein